MTFNRLGCIVCKTSVISVDVKPLGLVEAFAILLRNEPKCAELFGAYIILSFGCLNYPAVARLNPKP